MRRIESEQSLDELAGLADAAGASVALRMLQERSRPDPATFIGSGKAAALAAACAEADVDVVIFDNELSPAQLRQLAISFPATTATASGCSVAPLATACLVTGLASVQRATC